MDILKIVIFGPPGSGKDSQGQEIGKKLGVPYCSFRDCIVHHLNHGTDLAKEFKKHYPKKTVPAELMKKMFEKVVDLKKGYLINGYPNKEEEALSFIKEFRPTIGISLTVQPEVSKVRLLHRRVDPVTNERYNTKVDPPNGVVLKKLKRDSPANIDRRISSFLSDERENCVQVLRSRCHIIEMDGSKEKTYITSEICRRIEQHIQNLKKKKGEELGREFTTLSIMEDFGKDEKTIVEKELFKKVDDTKIETDVLSTEWFGQENKKKKKELESPSKKDDIAKKKERQESPNPTRIKKMIRNMKRGTLEPFGLIENETDYSDEYNRSDEFLEPIPKVPLVTRLYNFFNLSTGGSLEFDEVEI